jgi:uncharacterized membrane protein
MVYRFYDETWPDQSRQAVIEQYGVDYLFYGPAERLLGAYDPAASAFLSLVYENEQVQIYAAGEQ